MSASTKEKTECSKKRITKTSPLNTKIIWWKKIHWVTTKETYWSTWKKDRKRKGSSLNISAIISRFPPRTEGAKLNTFSRWLTNIDWRGPLSIWRSITWILTSSTSPTWINWRLCTAPKLRFSSPWNTRKSILPSSLNGPLTARISLKPKPISFAHWISDWPTPPSSTTASTMPPNCQSHLPLRKWLTWCWMYACLTRRCTRKGLVSWR